MFKCNKCEKEFKYISLLKKHESRKFSCINIDDYNDKIDNISQIIENKINESINNNATICLFCNKVFCNKSNLSKHIYNVCPNKKTLEKDKDKLTFEKDNKRRDDELKFVKNTVVKLLKKQSHNIIINNTNNTNITNNNNNNNNLIININSYGKEDLSHITLNDYKKYLNGFFPGFIKFIEKIHFDEQMPENHNICLTNIKSKYIHVFENDKWITKEKNDIIDTLITKKYNMLNDKCEELEENNKINEDTVENFKEFAENYDNEEAQRNTKENIMLLLYNNREKIKKI